MPLKFRKFFSVAVLTLLVFNTTEAKAWLWDKDKQSKYPAIPNEISKKTMCAKDKTKFGHTVILIDTTTNLSPARKDFIVSEVFGSSFYEQYEPFTKFSYVLINAKSPSSQEYVFSKCRPKSGGKTAFGNETESDDENLRNIQKAWIHFNNEANKAKDKIFEEAKESKTSLIYESFINVMQNPKLDFTSTSDYPKREIIIVSDLMQHAERLSFFKICKTKYSRKVDLCPKFKDIIKKVSTNDYIIRTTPEDKNIDIKIIYINNRGETKYAVDQSLLKLWLDYFEYSGFKKPKIKTMLDEY